MKCYYAWNNDDSMLLSSASGGIFVVLAHQMICNGGVVFGARFQENGFGVKHQSVRTMDELVALQGSKYVQSTIGDAYSEAADCLRTGQKVLFSGTPCQIAALKNYLKLKHINDDGLTTVEVLCHGVTNQHVVERYVASLSNKRGRRVTCLRFRTKKRPWYSMGSSMELCYEDGTEEIIDHLLDLFYLAYVNNVVLRPSCYHCPFAQLDGRAADFTIGDFWGAEDVIHDKERLRKGVGLVLLNTAKAEDVWRGLLTNGEVTAQRLDVVRAIPRNGALIEPAKEHPFRAVFFKRVDSEDFLALVEKGFGRMLWKNRIKNMIGYDNIQRLKQLKRRIREIIPNEG